MTEKQPLNILEVGSGFPRWGGTEIHLINLSAQLVSRGHRVTVACRPESFVERAAQEQGLRTVPITIRKWQDWRDRKKLQSLMREERFDVVHAHIRHDYFVPAMVARLSGVPVNLISHHSPRKLKGPEVVLYPRYLQNRIVALSESVRRLLLGQGIPPDKVVTIHHGTDTEAFRRVIASPESTLSRWNVSTDRFVVGVLGRVSREKGILFVLEALTQLPPEIPIHLLIVGDGKQETIVREAIASQALSDRVTMTGFVKDINDVVNALDVLVLASTWQEPCAAVVQQAMALGKPVVGTGAGGTPEMVVDGETGIVVPPADAGALAEALARLAGDPSLRASMGVAGRERADRLFTLHGMVDKIENLYYRELERAKDGK